MQLELPFVLLVDGAPERVVKLFVFLFGFLLVSFEVFECLFDKGF